MDDDSEPFRVVLKDSATAANEGVRRFAETAGRLAEFDSRAAAVERAERLSAEGSARVEIQATAPQDPTDADAYLVAMPARRHRDPDGSLDGTLTFDVTANQYGALGEALVCHPATNPPVLTYYARQDLGVSTDADLRVELDRHPDPVVVEDGDGTRKRWDPDCRAVVRRDLDGPPCREYWCEVKTGDGSFERSQRAVMRTKAREATVLQIRVDASDLPDSYAATIRPVEGAREGSSEERVDSTVVRADGENARLDDFG